MLLLPAIQHRHCCCLNIILHVKTLGKFTEGSSLEKLAVLKKELILVDFPCPF
jgi:hypothetical protein